MAKEKDKEFETNVMRRKIRLIWKKNTKTKTKKKRQMWYEEKEGWALRLSLVLHHHPSPPVVARLLSFNTIVAIIFIIVIIIIIIFITSSSSWNQVWKMTASWVIVKFKLLSQIEDARQLLVCPTQLVDSIDVSVTNTNKYKHTQTNTNIFTNRNIFKFKLLSQIKDAHSGKK